MSKKSAAAQAPADQGELWATLKKAVEDHQSTASYCCGGTVAIDASPAPASLKTAGQVSPGSTTKSPPVALRWDVKEAGEARTIHFPQASLVSKNTRSSSTSSQPSLLEQLLESCAPATFGRKNKDILDESYRKAGKLNRSQFSVDFHPHDYGIIDTISQVLLPQVDVDFMKGREQHRGVMAELYKLNVYSGPSGKFRAHVDTPRGATQFGSLVVCLPHPHEGGHLRVTHAGHSKHFDWSNAKATTIQWAAFYSDCEHEVLEVTSGHRVTLTYNLYVTESVGKILHPHPCADLKSFPLYQEVKQLIEAPIIFEAGQKLGFHCQHQYAHTRDGIEELMPFTLKGIDAIVFGVFQALGLKTTVKPRLQNQDYEDEDDHGHEYVGDKLYGLVTDWNSGWERDPEEERLHLNQVWPSNKTRNVTWLNDPTNSGWEMAYVGMTYGNEASLSFKYSHAIILIDVPEAEKNVSE
ncbi:hypothetical protein DL95DRAFT_428313 [Leptodontidium sp. 2 PMI_412]|nr:hypothetical protein DL95DRAFT_428313 [Leptodontidium sp. 2 PMI_412]